MLYNHGLFKHQLQKGNCSIMMQHDNKSGLKKNPVQWSGQVDFQAGQVTFKAYMVRNIQTYKFRRLFKDFSRTNYSF